MVLSVVAVTMVVLAMVVLLGMFQYCSCRMVAGVQEEVMMVVGVVVVMAVVGKAVRIVVVVRVAVVVAKGC